MPSSSRRSAAVTEDKIKKLNSHPTMLHEYLNSRPSVTDRLAMGLPVPNVDTKRVEFQNRLNEWQGSGVGMSATTVLVEEALRKLNEDLKQ